MKIKEITIDPRRRKIEELQSGASSKIYKLYDHLSIVLDDFRLTFTDVYSPEQGEFLKNGYSEILNSYLSSNRYKDQAFDVARYLQSIVTRTN